MRALLLLIAALMALAAPAAARELRVCADPNNLPFSNDKGEGFENKIAELVAKDLGATVAYHWRAQRRGYVRESLKGGECDLIPGVGASLEMLATTRPYYRSTYVFVTRAGEAPIASFDDPRLKTLKVGVQMIGDDFSNTPPAHALTRRGIVENIRGYMLYGDYAQPNPPARIVEAVTSGEIDAAVVWGPLAGWAAKRSPVPLTLTFAPRWPDGPQWPMVFDISMGVRKEDAALRREVERALAKNREAVAAILDSYGVPRLPLPGEEISPAAAR
ncbi:MAG TPA: substrate-binding domain-containing protein [Caulobacteraceae bacterium]